MITKNLTISGTRIVYKNEDYTVSWNCGKTGPGKAKVTGLQPINNRWAQTVINTYLNNWKNDRMSGVNEFCIHASTRGFVQALNFLE